MLLDAAVCSCGCTKMLLIQRSAVDRGDNRLHASGQQQVDFLFVVEQPLIIEPLVLCF